MSVHILVLNCGSSSIKFALFEQAGIDTQRCPHWSGKISGIGSQRPLLEIAGIAPRPLTLSSQKSGHDALLEVHRQVQTQLQGKKLLAVVHRVVHGGVKYFDPVRVDKDVLNDLRSFIPLAPLHQPFALEAIETLLVSNPELVQVACFDTAFHRSVAPVEQMLALPYGAWERGIRRYGFHGLSYHYLSKVLPERLGPVARGRVLAAHLGSGASLCALQELQSHATTMGFSALDGLMMGTRCGAIDPGAVIYLMEIEKLSLEQVAHLLYHESGLLGVSEVSADPSVLLPLESRDDAVGERVRAALALYIRRIVREAGALIAVLGGLDVLAFTAGIGEHNATIRERVCAALAWLGVRLDPVKNALNAPLISAADSQVLVVVEPTNEEWIAAQQANEVLCALDHQDFESES
jgi:acetate kinase